MEIILRTAGIYLFLLILFRVLGKRSLSQLSAFHFILFLIISEAVQNALVDDDRSVVMGLTVILTFLLLDLGLSILKKKYTAFEKLAEGVPLLLVERGNMIEENMARARITYSDILLIARESQGLERMDQIKYAVLETSGAISIIPKGADMESLLDSRINAVDRKLDAVLARLSNDKGATPH